MTLQECYGLLEGDYNDVKKRLLSDQRITKFAVKFLNDGSFEGIVNSIISNEYQKAFSFAHTLKGISQTLGFTKLSNSAAAMDALRRGNNVLAQFLLPQLAESYTQTTKALQCYQNGKTSLCLNKYQRMY